MWPSLRLQGRFEFFDVGGPNNFAGDDADKDALHVIHASEGVNSQRQ
jgi:hypothetical protein